MAEKTFLLVCEGETDIYIFEALAKHLSNDEIVVTVISLAPQLDATSGTYPSHSFGHVLNWCADNRSRIQMLLDFKGANALFLQMDTDIAGQANPDCIGQGLSPRHCCQEKLNQKLSATEEPPRCHYILPTQNTETWVLASHDGPALDENSIAISDYELITDTEQRLIALKYKGKKGVSNTAPRKLKKTPASMYKKHGEQLTGNLMLARQRCNELDRLCILLES
ncbi:MAG: hypothetical protein PSU84_09170 [Methylobacter sp.]|uniref:hypothetical protein n=1 Tax=Methylobacter sp. TaxID=2051955 RepID=UPI002487A761|nr:hypothetical protein [Methylobacter sp.]MDI1358378.1 hypothetical protein [Methylobacter sp.]